MDENKNLIVGRHYPEIDGLRAIAILMVLWWHASDFTSLYHIDDLKKDYLYFSLTSLGAQGVTIFFFISGFLITGILIDTAHDKGCLKKFYIRRALRIFPLYYLGLIYMAFLSFIFIPSFQLNEIFVHNLLYIQNWTVLFETDLDGFKDKGYSFFSHTWSLAIEEQFYIIWPFLFLYLYKRTTQNFLMAVMILLIVLSVLIRFYASAYMSWSVVWLCTITRMDALVLGSFFAYVHKIKPHFLETRKTLSLWCFAIFLMILILSHMHVQSIASDPLKFIVTYGVTGVTILCALAFIVILNGRSVLSRFLNLSILKHIAQVSYGLYIYHQPVFKITSAYVAGTTTYGYYGGHLMVLVVGGGISYLIALFSYTCFEKPILSLKDQWAKYEQ